MSMEGILLSDMGQSQQDRNHGAALTGGVSGVHFIELESRQWHRWLGVGGMGSAI